MQAQKGQGEKTNKNQAASVFSEVQAQKRLKNKNKKTKKNSSDNQVQQLSG